MSKTAERKAYSRACQKEIERMKNAAAETERKRRLVRVFLAGCTANLPMMGELTDEQRKAIRRIQHIAKTEYKFNTEFYDHIMEERRRWKNRKCGVIKNSNYDK